MTKFHTRMLKTGLFILTSSTLAVATSTAQEASIAGTAENVAAESDSIVVVTAPIRDSLERSLQLQRESDNIVNAIAADTLGRFPDATAAGALARLPAVGVQRDQGQERYIQVRGAPTRWTTVALDGINVLGAEGRIFRFDSVPAVQIDQLELNKTLLPEMPAEALAGRVNIKTYSPIENKGFSGAFDGGYGFGDLGDGPVKQYSGRVSWGGDKLAFSLSGSHFEFEQHTDNSEPRFANDRNGNLTIRELRITKYVITRQTESYSGKVQFKPSDDHLFTLSHLKTEFNDFEERNQYRWTFSNAFSVAPTNNLDSASFVGVPVVSTWEDGIYSNGVYLTRLGGEHEFGGWDANWDVAYTTTEFNTDTPLVSETVPTGTSRPTLASVTSLDSIFVDVNAEARGITTLTLSDTVIGPDGVPTAGERRVGLDSFRLDNSVLGEFSGLLETEAWTYKGDIGREYSAFGAEGQFKAGFQYDERSQGGASIRVRSGFGSLEAEAARLGIEWNEDAFAGGRAWDANHPFGYTANYVNTEEMFDRVRQIQAAYLAANGAPIFIQDPNSINTVDETVLAGYLQNRFAWDRQSLTFGLRVEQTEIDAEGVVSGTLAPLSLSSEETSVFPNLYYNFDYSDEVKLRAAFISGQARPSLSDLRANVSINDVNQSISGGNPNLVPEKAYGVDLSAEWYFAPASILSASVYHREVSDTLFDSQTVVGSDIYDAGGIDRTGYDYSTVLNGGDGYLTGLELTYYQPWTFLPGAWSGLGFQGSVALVDGEFDAIQEDGSFETAKFDGTSDTIFNATLFYEKYGLSARLIYQWRSDWVDVPFASGSSANSGLFWDETQRVDASIRYDLNERVGFYFDANNIFNELGVRYLGTEDRPYEVESFGRRFVFGARVNF